MDQKGQKLVHNTHQVRQHFRQAWYRTRQILAHNTQQRVIASSLLPKHLICRKSSQNHSPRKANTHALALHDDETAYRHSTPKTRLRTALLTSLRDESLTHFRAHCAPAALLNALHARGQGAKPMSRRFARLLHIASLEHLRIHWASC